MAKGFTEKEAKKLIGRSFETHAPFAGIPMRARGRVTEAFDTDDHWNVMIEWFLPGKPIKSWYNKTDLQMYMHPVEG
jgi:hypothetical protein